MSEPVTTAGGIKIAALVGAAFGSAIAVSLLPELSWWKRLLSFGTGLLAGYYGQDLALFFLGWPSALIGALSFVIGLAGMGLCGFVFHAASDPFGTIERLRGLRGGWHDGH